MTIERAYYHKLMLEAGLTEHFDKELDELLEQENPLSELVLALSTCGGDRNEQIHILNDYILSVPKDQNYADAVFSLVADEFLARYEKGPEALEQILRDMHCVANSFGFDANDLWLSMWELDCFYDELAYGAVTEEGLREAIVKLLRDRTPIFEQPKSQPAKMSQSIISKLIRAFTRKRS